MVFSSTASWYMCPKLADISLYEVNEAAEVVRAAATDETNIIFGATIDERLAGQIWITVVATGLGGARRRSAIISRWRALSLGGSFSSGVGSSSG